MFVRFGSVRFGSFVCVCVRLVVGSPSRRLARSLSIASACPLPPPLLLVPPPTRACVQCRSQHGRFATLVRHPYAGKYPGFAGHRCHGSMSRSWLVCARRSLVGADRRGARVANRMVSRSSTNEPRRFSSRRRSLATSSRKCRWSRPSTRAHSPRSRRSPPRRRRRTPRSRRGALLAAALYARLEPGKRVPHSPTSIVSCFRCTGGCARAYLQRAITSLASAHKPLDTLSLSRALELTALSRVSQNGQGRVGCDSPRARQASAEAPRL